MISSALIRTFTTVVLFLLGLSSCSSDNQLNDLQQFVEQVRTRPSSAIEPAPEFASYAGFIYGAASLRSPFDRPLRIELSDHREVDINVTPNFERYREILESQGISELAMVGMLITRGVFQGLIEDNVGLVHRVAVGNYVGRNYGRIVSISKTQIDVIEIVPSGSGGWVERPHAFVLEQRI
ncbi:MAG: pilus assembly protein PilP [SAR86 cluster bacterium]|uniref:Pilus assembly protein PilP n=1 Tax=SAR86 cluster bacterium TaxID=2030880 RepID=A0A2A4MM40_9GAMM|nr:MAG: pilus assembly protein PilP [SAR86 cluster bacterium]